MGCRSHACETPRWTGIPRDEGFRPGTANALPPVGQTREGSHHSGLYFADKAPKRTLVALPSPPAFGLFSGVDIPAGKSDFKTTDSFTLPVDVDLVSVGGHAHYLGKTLKTTATLPDKSNKKLFYIKDWDFNWQGSTSTRSSCGCRRARS